MRKGAGSVDREDFVSINRRITKQVVDAINRAPAETPIFVEAPPGAGKSTLICSVAKQLIDRRFTRQLPILTQTNEQADDLAAALTSRFPGLRIGRLVSGKGPSMQLQAVAAQHTNLSIGEQCTEQPLTAAQVVVGTARKWQYERARLDGTGKRFPVGLIDEAYQMRSDLLLGVASLFETLLCVGDPGQLDPFAQIDDSIWRGLPYSPTRSAMAVIRAAHSSVTPIQLPKSWRLPPSAAEVVSRAFYPTASFVAGSLESERNLTFGSKRLSRESGLAKAALEGAASTGWAYVELPEKFTVRQDDEVALELSRIVSAALMRGASITDERNTRGRDLKPGDIAVIAAHNDQVQAVRYQLHAIGVDPDAVTVSTANKIQGREYELVAVWHPLAGRRDATAFHLEAGRMCVMLSRHRQACIVVGRQGSGSLLSEFPDSDPIFLDEPEKFPDGWQANFEVLQHLEAHRV